MISRRISRVSRKMTRLLIMMRVSTILAIPSHSPSLLPRNPHTFPFPMTRNLKGKLLNLQRERERTSIGESGNARGENGLLRSVIQVKALGFWLGAFNTAEEAAKAYDAEAKRIRGKKAKVNFPDETQCDAQKQIPDPVNRSSIQNFDCFNDHMEILDEKPQVNNRSVLNYSSNACPFLGSDQESNTFNCFDFVSSDHGPKTPPEITSVLLNETTQLHDDGYKKVDLVGELLVFDNQMKCSQSQTPYLDSSNWDPSIDTFLNGDTAQDGGNPIDFWSFDDTPAMLRAGALF